MATSAPVNPEAAVAIPPAPGATLNQTITSSDGKPAAKDAAAKAKLDRIKSVTLQAMATEDADNAVLLQRIRQRFDKCARLLPACGSAADARSGQLALVCMLRLVQQRSTGRKHALTMFSFSQDAVELCGASLALPTSLGLPRSGRACQWR